MRRRTRVPKAIFPRALMRRFKYVELNFDMDPGTGLVSVYNFRANSAFDPNETEIGHQPYNWDQLSPFYKYYRVIRSHITGTFIHNQGFDMNYGITLTPDTNSITSLTNLLSVPEAGGATWKTVPPVNTGADAKKVILKKTFIAKRDLKTGVAAQTATTGQNPVDQMYFSMWAYDTKLGNPASLHCNAVIFYDVLLTERDIWGNS